MRPLPDHTTTLIRFSTNEPQSYMTYLTDIRNFLDPYKRLNDIENKENFAICNNSGKYPAEDVNLICRYNLDMLGDCSEATAFGYSIGKPCVLVKMNKVIFCIS